LLITKNELEIFGYVEYCCRYHPSNRIIHKNAPDNKNCKYQIEHFASLEEFLKKVKPEVLEEIKKANNADEVCISDICFQANFENIKTKGVPITVINKENISEPILPNVMKMMEIMDNHLRVTPC
jgi:hypothetical protein